MWCSQGSILGPLLFVVLVYDKETVLKQFEHILYADDAVLYTGNWCESILFQLLIDFGKIIVNLKKTKTECILFGTHKKTPKANL